MDRIAKDEDAARAARRAAIGALRTAGLTDPPTADGATGLSVIKTAARPRGAAIIVTLGGPDPLEVCAALDDAGVGSEYRGDEPWRIYVLAPGDAHPSEAPADVVDEHEHEVEDDGGDAEFEEVGTAAPAAVGVSFDRPVIMVMIEMVDMARRTDAFDDVADLADLGLSAMRGALEAFDERVASVTESEA